MIELFLQMPTALQIFCVMAMVVGLMVMWRLKGYVLAIGVMAILMYRVITDRKGK